VKVKRREQRGGKNLDLGLGQSEGRRDEKKRRRGSVGVCKQSRICGWEGKKGKNYPKFKVKGQGKRKGRESCQNAKEGETGN